MFIPESQDKYRVNLFNKEKLFCDLFCCIDSDQNLNLIWTGNIQLRFYFNIIPSNGSGKPCMPEIGFLLELPDSVCYFTCFKYTASGHKNISTGFNKFLNIL